MEIKKFVMQLLYFFWFSLFIMQISFPSHQHEFNNMRYLSDSIKIHKNLFPMNTMDYIGTFLVIIGLIISASGGIGGGGILVPLLILVFQFRSKDAIPLSNFTIFGGSISNLILNIPKRHPDVDRPLVDWNLITIMQPSTLAGAIIGTYFGKLFPDWILSLSLVVILAYTSMRTLEKGFKLYEKETKSRNEGSKALTDTIKYDAAITRIEEQVSLLSNDNDDDDIEEDEHENIKQQNTKQHTQKLDIKISNDNNNNINNTNHNSNDIQPAERIQIIEEEKNTSLRKVGWVCLMFFIVITLNLAKSAVTCGSFLYWSMVMFILIWILGISAVMRSILMKEWQRKLRVGYIYAEGDVEWNERNTVIYPLLCIFAGLIAGMFGVGGGIIFGPMMLEMGVHPLVASATSAVMIFFTAITATTSYITFGALIYDYGFYLFFISIVATAFGQVVVGHIVTKYKRNSIISLSIGTAIAISALLMSIESLYSTFADISEESSSAICK